MLLFQLCDTYPRYLYVPVSATTPILMGSAKFRSRGRLPVLSYLHRDNQVPMAAQHLSFTLIDKLSMNSVPVVKVDLFITVYVLGPY